MPPSDDTITSALNRLHSSAERDASGSRALARANILIVDDNPEKTLALQSVVEELNHRVVVATSAEDALRELLKQDFALALLDVHMPGMDGFELAALIRSRPAHQDLAIVFMSALDQSDARLENAYQLGAIDFVALPARRPLIKAKLKSILAQQERARRLPSPAIESTRRSDPSALRFRLLLDNAEDVAIFFLDTSGTVTEWSHAAALCTGWEGAEILGREFSLLFVPGESAAGVPRELLHAARTGRRGISDRWLMRKDGTRFWARCCIVALGAQAEAGFGIVLRDITGQRSVAQDLQIKAEVLECMNESVCVVDDDFRIIYANPAAYRIFGYEPRELLGSDVRQLNGDPPAENESGLDELMKFFEHSRHWSGEWRNRRKDGTTFVTHTRLSVFHHQGSRYFICVQEDLTTRRQAEAAILRTAQLQEVVGELEAFSYSVSHDLKSPLRTLRGFADAVIHDYGEALQGTGLNHMHRIRRAAERLEKMVEDILSASRLSRDALPLTPIDPHHVISALLEEMPQFRAPQAEIRIADTLPLVLGHEASLRQVFFNLLANAVKFVPPGRTPLVTIHAETTGSDVILSVEDNGVGIRPEDQERIFQAFERTETTPPFPGNGVGLAIVQRTISRLGGSVGVRSRPGAGSRFWIKLRAASA